MEKITQKEFKVIESISKNKNISQRDIASESGVSLGLVNILINRLVKKGYLKASKLNARKIKYIVTPKGIRKKANKTYKFMKRSFLVMGQLRSIIADFAIQKHKEGKREFLIIGKGELSDITELVLKSLQLSGLMIRKKDKANGFAEHGVVFNTTRQNDGKIDDGIISIWEKAEELYGSNYEF